MSTQAIPNVEPPPTEPFVGPDRAAQFVQLHRKTILRFARQGLIPAHPVAGEKRKKWRFLISELDSWARARVNSNCDRCQNQGANECWRVIRTVVCKE
jgi:hypothetical protein